MGEGEGVNLDIGVEAPGSICNSVPLDTLLRPIDVPLKKQAGCSAFTPQGKPRDILHFGATHAATRFCMGVSHHITLHICQQH